MRLPAGHSAVRLHKMWCVTITSFYRNRKWACCHIFSVSSFYIIIIIDCMISFQLTHSHLMRSFLSLKSLSLISRQVVLHEVYSISYILAWTFHHVSRRQAKALCSQGIFVPSFWVAHNWSHCNKPTDCQVLVCKLLHFIYWIYAQTFKPLLSLPSYPFGSKNHFCHQSQRPWIITSKKAMPRSSRPTLLLTLCTLVIKILSHYSIGRWLTLMVCTLFCLAMH